MRKINDAGLALVKEFEGLRLNAYQDIVGMWTIGYGHTKGVRRGQSVTSQEAEELLRGDLAEAEAGVENVVKVELSDNQFSALVSFAYNLGIGTLRRSTLLKQLNLGNYAIAAAQILRFDHAGGKKVAGLTRRRQAERALFLAFDELPAVVEVSKKEKPEVIPPVVETKTETSFISNVTDSPQVKEIAKTGMSAVGNRIAQGGLSAGSTGATWGVITGNWKVIVAGLVFIVVGAALWALIYYQRKQIQILTAQINSDRAKDDVKFTDRLSNGV